MNQEQLRKPLQPPRLAQPIQPAKPKKKPKKIPEKVVLKRQFDIIYDKPSGVYLCHCCDEYINHGHDIYTLGGIFEICGETVLCGPCHQSYEDAECAHCKQNNRQGKVSLGC